MVDMDFRPGDKVIYRDRDQIQWGPWEVLDVSGDMVTLVVEKLVTCLASVDLLEKVGQHRELV